jgi:hypothetical protein
VRQLLRGKKYQVTKTKWRKYGVLAQAASNKETVTYKAQAASNKETVTYKAQAVSNKETVTYKAQAVSNKEM